MDEQSKKSMTEQGRTVFSGFVAQEVEQASKDAGYDFSRVGSQRLKMIRS
jgi:hypothetical protein